MDTFSPNVMMTSLKLVPQKVCQKNHRSDFKKYVTYSSFCAGWANGSAVCNGDSGGGLMLRNPNGRWEVHGIVSVSPRKVDGQFCDPDYYTIFTKVYLLRLKFFELLFFYHVFLLFVSGLGLSQVDKKSVEHHCCGLNEEERKNEQLTILCCIFICFCQYRVI